MKQLLTKILLASTLLVTANAGDKFGDISEEYLHNNTSVDVRMVIAKDPQTSPKILKFLIEDSNKEVREYARKNLN